MKENNVAGKREFRQYASLNSTTRKATSISQNGATKSPCCVGGERGGNARKENMEDD